MLHLMVDCFNVFGLILGICGSALLFKFTLGLELPSYCGSADSTAQMNDRNRIRKIKQNTGFKLLLTGFIFQLLAVLTPYIHTVILLLKTGYPALSYST